MSVENLTEPAVIPDVFASGLADAEDLGDGNIRLTFYARQRSSYDPRTYDNIVVARIVMSLVALPDAIKQTLTASGGKHYEDGRLEAVHMH